jgi:Domain of unknown function (DUF4832)
VELIKRTLLMVGFLVGFAAPPVMAQETLVFRPREITDVLVNPGMGIETFQRFNGDAPNPGLKWSEEGPIGPIAPAAVKPDFPDASVSYCRWFWSALEPEHGKIRWDIIDSSLEAAREHHQTLDIRMMPYDQRHPLPEWYRNSGARRANKPTDKDGDIWQPDFSDPLYLKYWGELVAAAGARYDGHPYLDAVDVSSVGYWGEGWSDYMPPFEFQKALIDIYLKAFQRTPLLMNFDEEHALAYGTQHGTGWRLDCWGDMRDWSGAQWCHMLDFYPQQIVRAGIQDVWQRSPVSLETCGVPAGWHEKGWNLDYILAQALRWHASTINVKSSLIPADWKGQFEEFQKRLGYRLILRRLEYPREVQAGRMEMLHMWWLNAGVAPPYRPYELAVELNSGEQSALIKLPVDVRKWLPGDAVFDGTVYIPSNLKPGAYKFRIALLDPRTETPALKLAVEGLQPDGWYDFGEIQVR